VDENIIFPCGGFQKSLHRKWQLHVVNFKIIYKNYLNETKTAEKAFKNHHF
jgi:hypothetical protein